MAHIVASTSGDGLLAAIDRVGGRVSVVTYASEAPVMTAATAQRFDATVAAAVAQLSSS